MLPVTVFHIHSVFHPQQTWTKTKNLSRGMWVGKTRTCELMAVAGEPESIAVLTSTTQVSTHEQPNFETQKIRYENAKKLLRVTWVEDLQTRGSSSRNISAITSFNSAAFQRVGGSYELPSSWLLLFFFFFPPPFFEMNCLCTPRIVWAKMAI